MYGIILSSLKLVTSEYTYRAICHKNGFPVETHRGDSKEEILAKCQEFIKSNDVRMDQIQDLCVKVKKTNKGGAEKKK